MVLSMINIISLIFNSECQTQNIIKYGRRAFFRNRIEICDII